MIPIVPKRIFDSLQRCARDFCDSGMGSKQLARISFVVRGGKRIHFSVTYQLGNLERDKAPWKFDG